MISIALTSLSRDWLARAAGLPSIAWIEFCYAKFGTERVAENDAAASNAAAVLQLKSCCSAAWLGLFATFTLIPIVVCTVIGFFSALILLRLGFHRRTLRGLRLTRSGGTARLHFALLWLWGNPRLDFAALCLWCDPRLNFTAWCGLHGTRLGPGLWSCALRGDWSGATHGFLLAILTALDRLRCLTLLNIDAVATGWFRACAYRR